MILQRLDFLLAAVEVARAHPPVKANQKRWSQGVQGDQCSTMEGVPAYDHTSTYKAGYDMDTTTTTNICIVCGAFSAVRKAGIGPF